MIDDLSTRVAMTVAAMLLSSAGIAVISLSEASTTVESVRGLARHVARAIDALGRIDAEVAVRFGSDGDAEAQLPRLLDGGPYRLVVGGTDVRVHAGAFLAVEELHVRVHPLSPSGARYTREELDRLSRGNALEIDSGTTFLVVRTARIVDGRAEFLTFAFVS